MAVKPGRLGDFEELTGEMVEATLSRVRKRFPAGGKGFEPPVPLAKRRRLWLGRRCRSSAPEQTADRISGAVCDGSRWASGVNRVMGGTEGSNLLSSSAESNELFWRWASMEPLRRMSSRDGAQQARSPSAPAARRPVSGKARASLPNPIGRPAGCHIAPVHRTVGFGNRGAPRCHHGRRVKFSTRISAAYCLCGLCPAAVGPAHPNYQIEPDEAHPSLPCR